MGAVESKVVVGVGPQGLRVYSVSPLHKVLPEEEAGADWTPGRASVDCARNEGESFQVVVQSDQPISGLAVQVTELTAHQGASLPAKLLTLRKVEWVDVNVPYDPKEPSTKPILRPDPLPLVDAAADRFSVEPGKNLVFWLTLAVPMDARPGLYSGRVSILSGSDPRAVLHVTARVRSFALPKRPILQSMIGMSESNIYRAHGAKTREEKEKVIRAYLEEYIRARLGPFLYAPGTMAFNPLPDATIRWEFAKDTSGKLTGEVALDFTGFDREAKYYLDERQAFSAFNFAPYILHRQEKNGQLQSFLSFSDSGGASVQRILPNGSVNPVFEPIVVSFFRQVGAHLAGKGWLDRAVYYVADEPPESDAELIKQVCLLVRQGDARIRTAVTYDPASRPRLAEVQENGKSLITLWIPNANQYREDVAAAERKKGADYWLYDIKDTALISHSGEQNRAMFWDVWRRNANGYVYYLSTNWGGDATPWERPNFLLPGVNYQYRHGDGYFFYPPERKYNPEKPVLDRVVTTIRWELMREGAEDYDMLRILERRTAEAEARQLSVATKGRKALADARAAADSLCAGSERFAIRDLLFDAQPGWSFSAQEGWLHHPGGTRSDLLIRLRNIAKDGRYELVLNVYDDSDYWGRPYSRFLVNGQPFASPGISTKGPTNVPAGPLEVNGGETSFTLSSLAEAQGVIVYRVGLKWLLGRAGSLYAARACVADAIEVLDDWVREKAG
ncbi:glycoside hydrolase domain-containing protein [Myxococcus sp. RHSTA-1-4]|uniref:glycoside hydrolase domain-containing protein n=1 Tax=Myxococcus sp. RHSTA-1-4 TaxID=2874601 RepID=UPI001CC0DB11|nr:glycoside hydrolase domain-containing protein [Myxococcus sp. RHSTA-1-4]MBZ4421257.1 DUF4091 domain-containing protein [Myxococcus sp. RHSTA-1-4]